MKEQRQEMLFEIDCTYTNTLDEKYIAKVNQLIYEPKGRKPFPQELVDQRKYQQLIHQIDLTNVSEEEKTFLRLAAARHLVFDFCKIADYYAQSLEEMQQLMEDSALVILDFNQAIELGYVSLSNDIAAQFLEEYCNGSE